MSTKKSYYISSYLGSLLDKWQLQPEIILIGTALLVGIGTGIGAVVFRYLIQLVGWIGYKWLPQLIGDNHAYVIIVPAIGGLLVGLIVYFFAPEAKGHGVPEVMEAVVLRGGRVRPVVGIVKSLASALCIGSGGSVGREGPIVQIGSAFGSFVGQFLHLSDDRVRNLVACGAASGIAATFNAPIAGVVFALEVILGEFNVQYFSTVVISSVAANVIGQAVFGDVPAFLIPMEYGLNSLWEYGFYPVLGLLAAIVGVTFVRVLYWSEDLFDKWNYVPEWLKPAIGGTLLGILALVYPYVTGVTWNHIPQMFGVGYEVIEAALSNELTLVAVITLLVLKLIATSLTLGSGGSGGVFAPSLFLGAMVGVIFALVVDFIFPGIAAPPGAYALLGMGAVFSASARAPITAILILFELTGNYRIIMPLMLTVVTATIVAQKMLDGESIYTLKLTRRGVRLQRGHDVDVLQSVTVGEVMHANIDTVDLDMTLRETLDMFNRSRHHGLPVLNRQGELWGIVTISDIDRAVIEDKPRSTTIADIGTPRERLLTAYPDDTIDKALTAMAKRGFGRLPVISRENPNHLVGLVRRIAIVRAYHLALSRRAKLQHYAQRIQLRNLGDTEFVDFTLQPQDKAVDKTVQDLASGMPHECILISIRRDGRVLIPHGNTVFQTGDHITSFVRSEDIEKLYSCMRGEQKSFDIETTVNS